MYGFLWDPGGIRGTARGRGDLAAAGRGRLVGDGRRSLGETDVGAVEYLRVSGRQDGEILETRGVVEEGLVVPRLVGGVQEFDADLCAKDVAGVVNVSDFDDVVEGRKVEPRSPAGNLTAAALTEQGVVLRGRRGSRLADHGGGVGVERGEGKSD